MINIKSFQLFNDSNVILTPEEEAKHYFEEAALRKANDDTYAPLCFMPIDDFLAVCNKGYDERKHAIVGYFVMKGIKLNEIPYLCFTHDNNGNAKVVGHEGRHRAKVLKSMGVKTIPVLMKNYRDGEGSYAINKENIENPPEYFEEEFPITLRGELNSANNRVPFPIKLH